MYSKVAHTEDATQLNQGDILTDFYRPQAFVLRTLRGSNQVEHPFKEECLTNERQADLRYFSKVDMLKFAVVVSNSCNNYSGVHPVLLCPVRDFKFKNTEGTPECWEEVRRAATSTGSPKLFYLSGSEEFQIPRSDILLADIISVNSNIMTTLLGKGRTRRVACLDDKSISHLQLHLSLLFGRNPRDDEHWASRHDLELKMRWLDDQIGKSSGTSRHEKNLLERDELKKRLAKKIEEEPPSASSAD